MRTGSKVIFNQEYVDEIIRHRDIAQRKYTIENIESVKQQAAKTLDAWEKKLEFAECFQDTILEIKNTDIPNLTTVKTMGGHEYPISVLQVI